jgi:hypothetical protein
LEKPKDRQSLQKSLTNTLLERVTAGQPQQNGGALHALEYFPIAQINDLVVQDKAHSSHSLRKILPSSDWTHQNFKKNLKCQNTMELLSSIPLVMRMEVN